MDFFLSITIVVNFVELDSLDLHTLVTMWLGMCLLDKTRCSIISYSVNRSLKLSMQYDVFSFCFKKKCVPLKIDRKSALVDIAFARHSFTVFLCFLAVYLSLSLSPSPYSLSVSLFHSLRLSLHNILICSLHSPSLSLYPLSLPFSHSPVNSTHFLTMVLLLTVCMNYVRGRKRGDD